MITIGGKKYVVIENMGFIHSRGTYGKVIDYNGKERIVIKINRKWILAKPLLMKKGSYTGQ